MADRELIFYDERGAAYQPVRHFNRVTGRSAYRVKPRGATNRTDDFLEVDTVEEVARAMLVEGLPARVKALTGGPVSALRFGADLLRRYELDPAIAARLGVPAASASSPSGIAPELMRLRSLFLAAFPDFEAAGAFAGRTGRYHDTYRARVDALLAEAAGHPRDGWAVLRDLLTASQGGRGAAPPFFDGDVNWRVPRARDVDPAMFDRALDALVRGAADPAAAITAFNETLQPALKAIGEPNTFRDTRVVPSTVLATVAPDRAITARYTIYSHAERLLNGRTLFSNRAITADEYRAVLALADQIKTALIAWGWSPRDLWDVHGFVLTTCSERSVTDASADNGSRPVGGDATAAEKVKQLMIEPTNLILYGPPGTGKTYATAREAVVLCDGAASPDDADVRTRYAELVTAGQVRFVTFHQSYAYEDFIEGLRPITGEVDGGSADAGFRLEPVPGIFREIASVAEQALKSAGADASFNLAERQIFKMSLGRAGAEDHIFDAAIEGGYVVLGWGGDIDWTPYDTYDAIFARWNQDHPGTNGNDGNIAMVNRFRADMREGDLVVVSYGNTRYRAIGEIVGPYEFAPTGEQDYNHRRAVRWLFVPDEPLPVTFYDRPFTMRSCYLLREQYLKREALALVLPGAGGAASTPKQFVLVCDEINRANISKVFGELITLIEPDKRLGAEHELKVTLPYSKQAFGVPANLHIVGTMNTADRSIALLDTALRRRFEFRELMPQPGLLDTVDGIDLVALLTSLNERIEYLFDREHQIGHAYFMACKNRADIDEAMRRKVIPLLAEYFYEDWAKVAAVLGDADDGEGDREGRFIDRRSLTAPKGMGVGEDAAPRYRWLVRESFSYEGFVAG